MMTLLSRDWGSSSPGGTQTFVPQEVVSIPESSHPNATSFQPPAGCSETPRLIGIRHGDLQALWG